jgi:hypothetical protein
MKPAGALALALWVAVAAACKDGASPAQAAKEALAQTDQLVDQEADLLSRRDSLVKARQRIRDERAQLAESRRQALASGADTRSLDEAATELDARERQLEEREAGLDGQDRELRKTRAEWLRALAQRGGGGETAMTARESRMAERERDLAARERQLAERERELAKREAETCGGAQPTTIIRTVDIKGSKYTKKDVEPLLTAARRGMSQRGILPSDLPEPAQGLEAEANTAMAEGDYGRARLAAQQLAATIKAIHIDKSFIAAKISRLNGAIKGKTFASDRQAEVDGLFRDATAAYGDGKFAGANRSLNKIYAAIR